MGRTSHGLQTLQAVLLAGVLLAGTAGAATAVGAIGAAEPWHRVERSISYGPDDPGRQVLHAYLPSPRRTGRPAVLFFHGGSFVAGSPVDATPAARFLTERGYATFLVGYRLFDPDSGTNPWPAQLHDAQRAVRWVRAHAADYGVDAGRVCAAGHSSGGQLAGLLGTTDAPSGPSRELAGYSSRVDCVVMIAGDADLTVPYEHAHYTRLLKQLLGGSLSERPEAYTSASPAHQVDARSAPFLVIHGSDDALVAEEQVDNLVAAFEDADGEVTTIRLPQDHISILHDPLAWELAGRFLALQLHPER